MGKSPSGPHHKTSWSFLIRAPPACGCPRSSARARPVVSAGLPRGRALTALGEGESEAGIVGPGCFNPESQGLGQGQGSCLRQREEAGPRPGWSLCLPSHQHMLLHLLQPARPAPSIPLCSAPFCSLQTTPFRPAKVDNILPIPLHCLLSYLAACLLDTGESNIGSGPCLIVVFGDRPCSPP